MSAASSHATPLPPVLSAPASRSLFITDTVFTFLATLFVLLRLYSRRLNQVELGADDWLSVVALFFLYVFFVNEVLNIFSGYAGHHIEQLVHHPEILLVFGKHVLAGQVLYPLPVTFARFSLNLLFIRVFSIPLYKRFAYWNIALNVCWCLYCIIAPLARCSPIAKQWNPSITTGNCTSLTQIQIIIPIWSIICDLVTWVLPLPIVWRLQMSLASRIGLSCIFAIGLIIMGIDGARVATIYVQSTNDITFDIALPATIVFLECSLSIMCSCCPTLKPALSELFCGARFTKLFSKMSNQRSALSNSRESRKGLVGPSNTDASVTQLNERGLPLKVLPTVNNMSSIDNPEDDYSQSTT